jgi:ABC-type cobalamin/Fe3+-siderophores transport system ATPase subunit
MSNTNSLFTTLDGLRRRTARFRRVALHIHSPESHDWAQQAGDKLLNDRTKLSGAAGEKVFAEHLKNHFHLVAITDHMKCSLASRMSQATQQDGTFLVLPAMEVNIQPEAAISCSRLHVLTILPEGSSPERFSRFFSGLMDIPDDAHRDGQETVKGVRLEDFITRVHKEGGICIAAHVNSQKGVRHHFRQTSRDILSLLTSDSAGASENEQQISDILKEYLFSVGFDAVEVAKAADQRHYRWFSTRNDREVSIPIIMHSDAHCIEEFDRPERITWVKMTNLSLKGLQEALRFAETRIRFTADLPTPPSPRLLGVEITGSQASLFEGIHIAFAENLTCLIGPRGSGKSTVVESLRYVFGYNRTLGELDAANKLSARIRDMQKANLTDCIIRVAYQTTSQDKRILEATFDPEEDYTTKVYSPEGELLNVADVEKCGDYPLRLFGWSEIETLGREPGRQRELLDRLIPELSAVREQRDSTRGNLRSNRKDAEKIVAELRDILSQQNGIIRRYTEYKEAFDKLNTEEVRRHFTALDLAQGKKRVLEMIQANVSALSAKLGGLDAMALREGVDELLTKAEESLRGWWLTEELERLAIVDVETDVQKHISAAVELLNSFAALLGQHVAGLDQEIASIHGEIRATFAEDASLQRIADLRANAEKRLREATAVRVHYLKAWNRLKDTLAVRKQIADALIACHDQIASIRARHNRRIEDTLNQYFGDRMRISLRFVASGDQRSLIEALTKSRIAASFAAQYRNRRIPELLAAHFNPITLVRAVISGKADQFAEKMLPNEAKTSLSSAEAEKAIEAWKPWNHDDHAQVDTLADDGARLITLMTTQEVEWEDDESILLNGRPVGELSPGQRSSAMLPLIALAESTPLVIDQPEDNLDNRLVGHVLTDILAALKEQRQIIVCTHNPNIVVSGDAEQVVVLDAISDRKAKVSHHGSIDNEDIVQSVIEIMEGGREAFRVRQQRYQMDGAAGD